MQRSGADYAIAVSGIAGPDGGTTKNRSGQYGWPGASREHIRTRCLCWPVERSLFQTMIAAAGLDMIRRILLGIDEEPRYFAQRRARIDSACSTRVGATLARLLAVDQLVLLVASAVPHQRVETGDLTHLVLTAQHQCLPVQFRMAQLLRAGKIGVEALGHISESHHPPPRDSVPHSGNRR